MLDYASIEGYSATNECARTSRIKALWRAANMTKLVSIPEIEAG